MGKLGRSIIKMEGRRFGRYVVIEMAPRTRRQIHYRCVCDCGTERTVNGEALRTGNTKSCGCLAREQRLKTRLVHGHNRKLTPRSKAYQAWANMKTRCGNPKATHYRHYGGRGVRVCERWMTFENFLADMGEPPPGLTIDRINNNGHYEPGNCQWATMKQQAANRRNTRKK